MPVNNFNFGFNFRAKNTASPQIKGLSDQLKGLKETGTKATDSVADGFFKIGVVSQNLQVAKGMLRGLFGTTNDFAAFENSMAEVSTLVDTSVVNMGDLSKQVLELSDTYANFPVDTAKALYTTISAGFSDTADAQEVLNVASKLAIGGVTDTNTALKGMTATLKAWGLEAKDATSVSDAMFVAMRAGQALDLDTEIPTPSGFVKIKDLQNGDEVFDENGNIVKIVYAHDVIQDAESYELEFSDGTKVLACANHNWLTYTDRDRRVLNRVHRSEQYVPKSNRKLKGITPVVPTVKTTKDILNDFKPENSKLFQYRHYVPINGVVQFDEQVLDIDPYLLGAWLGDGATACSAISGLDLEIFQKYTDLGYEVVKTKGDNCDWNIKRGSNTKAFITELRDLGVLGNKHIPEIYHVGSIEQRLQLLQGLMDTDGTIDTQGRCEFSSVTKNLAYGVKRLLNSLGMKATISEKHHKNKNHKLLYRVYFIPTRFNPFKLKRKKERVKESYRENNFLAIVKITKIKNRPMRCLTVTGKNSLFLVGHNFIVTHNTNIGELSSSIGDVAGLAAQAGVSFQEILAGTSALTLGGNSTGKSMTMLKSVLAAVIRQGPMSVKWAKKLGIEFNTTALKARGLQGWLQHVKEKVGGNDEAMTRLFGRLEGLSGVFALTGKQAGNFNNILRGMDNSSGETEKAYKKMTNTVAFQTKRMKVQWQIFKITIGKALVPLFKIFANIFKIFIGFFKWVATTFPTMTKVVVSIGAIILILGVLIGTIILVKVQLMALLPILIGALAPMLPFLLPIIAAIAGIVALGVALRQAYKNNLGGFADTLNDIGYSIDLVIGSMWEMATTGEIVGDRVQGVLDNKSLLDIIQVISWVRAAFINLFQGIVTGFKVVSVLDPLINSFKQFGVMINRLTDIWNNMWDSAGGTQARSAKSTMEVIKDIGVVLGIALGVVAKVFVFFLSTLINGLSLFIEVVSVTFMSVFRFIKGVIKLISGDWRGGLADMGLALWDFIAGSLDAIGNFAFDIITNFLNMFGIVGGTWTEFKNFFVALVVNMGSVFVDVWKSVTSWFVSAWVWVKDQIASIFTWIENKMKWLGKQLGKVGKFVNKLNPFSSDDVASEVGGIGSAFETQKTPSGGKNISPTVGAKSNQTIIVNPQQQQQQQQQGLNFTLEVDGRKIGQIASENIKKTGNENFNTSIPVYTPLGAK